MKMARTASKSAYRVLSMPVAVTLVLFFQLIGHSQPVEQNGNNPGAAQVLAPAAREAGLILEPQQDGGQIIRETNKSPQIGYETPSAEIIRNGDLNLGRALFRLPSVQVGRMGELNLRGAGRNRFGLQMDGLPLASTSFSGRATDPAVFPLYLVQNIRIIHTPTPDMDPSGLGGVVVFESLKYSGDREIQVNAAGIALSDYSILAGLGRTFSLAYSERFNPVFSMSAQLVHQLENDGFESLGLEYGAQDFGAGHVDVIERLSPALNSLSRSQSAGRVQFNYEPDDNHRYFIYAIIGNDRLERQRHRNIYNANNDWIDPFTTGNVGQRGVFSYNPLLENHENTYQVYQAGSSHRFQNTWININAGMSSNTQAFNRYDFLYSRDRLNYQVNWDQRFRPDMEITNIRLLDDGTVDQRSMVFNNVNRFRNDQTQTRHSIRVDLASTLGILDVKTGASVLMSNTHRRYEEGTLSTLRTYHLIRFSKIPRSNFDVLGTYYFPDIINLDLAARYVDTSRPDMRLTEDDLLRRSLTSNYDIGEDIYAGYLMTSLALGDAAITAGLRVELTNAEYTGRRVLFNRFGFFDSSHDTTRTSDYLDLFPFASVTYEISQGTRIQATVSRSVQRPDHHILAPYELLLAADTLRRQGNPNLKPAFSDNIDVMFEHRHNSGGFLSAGLFYSRQNNLVIATEQRQLEVDFPFLTPNPPDGHNVRVQSFANSDREVNHMGFTLNMVQNLNFLPGFLHRLQVSANYSRTYTDAGEMRDEEHVYLRHVSPHTVNAALLYTQGRISGQIAWHYSAPSLSKRSTQLKWAPRVNPEEMVYLDQFEDGWSELSIYLSLKISDRFRIWANVHNVFPGERQLFGDNRDAYVFDTIRNNGLKVLTGIQFSY